MEKPRFLYHGSSVKVEALEPYQAYDWGHEEGCQFGVFATSVRDVALAFALGKKPDGNGKVGRVIRKKHPDDPIQMIFWEGTPNLGGKGYLYTLSSQDFLNAGGTQWACPHRVIPLEVTEILVDEYTYLNRA